MWRRPCQQLGGVAREQPDVADGMGLDLRQDLGHAVDIGFAANEADLWKGAGFGDQMFAAAESDFEPEIIDRHIEQTSEIGGAGLADVERKPRQQVLDQVGLVETELVALAPSEKRTGESSGSAVMGRGIAVGVAMGGTPRGDAHRSV